MGITTHSLEAISGCGPVCVFWRGTVDVVQWVCSGGEQWMWSSGCVQEGNSGCGPVGVFWRETVGEFWRLLVGVVQWVWS